MQVPSSYYQVGVAFDWFRAEIQGFDGIIPVFSVFVFVPGQRVELSPRPGTHPPLFPIQCCIDCTYCKLSCLKLRVCWRDISKVSKKSVRQNLNTVSEIVLVGEIISVHILYHYCVLSNCGVTIKELNCCCWREEFFCLHVVSSLWPRGASNVVSSLRFKSCWPKVLINLNLRKTVAKRWLVSEIDLAPPSQHTR